MSISWYKSTQSCFLHVTSLQQRGWLLCQQVHLILVLSKNQVVDISQTSPTSPNTSSDPLYTHSKKKKPPQNPRLRLSSVNNGERKKKHETHIGWYVKCANQLTRCRLRSRQPVQEKGELQDEILSQRNVNFSGSHISKKKLVGVQKQKRHLIVKFPIKHINQLMHFPVLFPCAIAYFFTSPNRFHLRLFVFFF